MAKYYFHTEDGQCFPDEDGIELSGIEEAKSTAVEVLVEALKGKPEVIWHTGDWRVIVTDEANLIQFQIQVMVVSSPATPPSALPRRTTAGT